MNPLPWPIKWKLYNEVDNYIPGIEKKTGRPFWKRYWNKPRERREPSENDTKLMADMTLETRRPNSWNTLSLRSQTITIHSAVGTAFCLSVLTQVPELCSFLFRSPESRLTLLMLPGLNQPKVPTFTQKIISSVKWLQMKAVHYAFPVEDQVASPGWTGPFITQLNPVLSFAKIVSTIPIFCYFFVLCGVGNTSRFSILLPVMSVLWVFPLLLHH